MQSRTLRFVVRATGPLIVAIAAASPVLQGPQREHRRSTDPPIPARGKLGQELFLAIDHRDTEAVKSLLARGADPNSRNGLEFTPLYVAAASHQPEVMEALIAAKADIDAESTYGTALTFAAMGAHAEGAHMLLAKGANPNAARGDGTTVLMMASYSGHPQIVAELLARKAKVNEQNGTEADALIYAAKAGNVEAGKLLIRSGAKLELRDVDGQTALMFAAKAGHADFVKLLLDSGAKPDAKDAKGWTALMLASAYGDNPEVVRALIAHGADRRLRDPKGRTAANLASARGYTGNCNVLGVAARASVAKTPTMSASLGLRLLERSMTAFSNGTDCISCHQEGLGRMTTAVARQHGLKTDPSLAKAQIMRLRGALAALKPLHEQACNNPEIMKQVPLIEINEVNTGYGWMLAGMAAQGDAPSDGTAAMADVIAKQQAPDGSWTFSLPRVPMQSSFFTYTALIIRDLKAYAPKNQAAATAAQIAKAKVWLLGAPAKTSDDLAFRLLGLQWAGSTSDERKSAVSDLLAAQKSDGGWSQAPGTASDAYATGQALYALRVAGGLPANHPAIARGVKYLLRTQDDDGSWFVNKRAIPANNYFDAAFPHGESQYASFNATCWAVMGLLESQGR